MSTKNKILILEQEARDARAEIQRLRTILEVIKVSAIPVQTLPWEKQPSTSLSKTLDQIAEQARLALQLEN